MKPFPPEIKEQIAIYLPFNKAIAMLNYEGWKLNIYGHQHYAFLKACELNHLKMLKYMYEMDTTLIHLPVIDLAAIKGHLDIIKWLHLKGSKGATVSALDWASKFGHLEIVRFLHSNRSEGCTKLALEGSVTNGHLEIVMFLVQNRTEGDIKEALRLANVYERKPIIEYLQLHSLGLATVPKS